MCICFISPWSPVYFGFESKQKIGSSVGACRLFCEIRRMYGYRCSQCGPRSSASKGVMVGIVATSLERNAMDPYLCQQTIRASDRRGTLYSTTMFRCVLGFMLKYVVLRLNTQEHRSCDGNRCHTKKNGMSTSHEWGLFLHV
jgi:hypothetical protein